MKLNIFISILLNITLILFVKSEDHLSLETLLDWSKRNDIKISSKIKISFEKEVNATALEDIPAKTEIITIPEKMILNIDKILDLINCPKLKAQYENFVKLKIDSYKEKNDEIHKEEIFLSYIFYLMKNEKRKYKETKFYKEFKELILSIEKFVSDSPLLYTNEQKQYFSGTYLGQFSQEIRKLINKEVEIFKNVSYYNKTINIDDYIHKRLFIFNRGFDTTKKELGEIIIAPLYTLFPFDSMRANARLDVKYKHGAKIITTYEIKKGNQITVISHSRTNVEKMVFEGRMNNYYTNYRENYLIPAYSPYMYYKYDIDDIKLLESYYFNIFEINFQKNAPTFYKEHADVFKVKNPTNLWACYMVQENLEYYKNFVENLMKRIDELFKGENEEKINNIHKALKGELMNLKYKYERFVEVCGYEKDKEKDNVIKDEDL
mgnify:CR=1 FL=1